MASSNTTPLQTVTAGPKIGWRLDSGPDDPLSDAKALDELRWQLMAMLRALDEPILEDKD
jgi:hypothetical protein